MGRPRAALRNSSAPGGPVLSSVTPTPARLQLPSVPKAPEHQLARITLTVPEVATVLGLSRTKTYEAIANGQIPSVKIGRRLLVPAAAFNAWLAGASAPSPLLS
jgi:excisionase family DNA binding protein